MAENFANNARTVLAAAVDADDSPLQVVSAGDFPSPPFRIRIGGELMLVTAVGGTGGTSWTVTRHVEATAAAGHAAGDVVTQVLTASGLTSLPAGTIGPTTPTTLTGYLKGDGTDIEAQAAPIPIADGGRERRRPRRPGRVWGWPSVRMCKRMTRNWPPLRV